YIFLEGIHKQGGYASPKRIDARLRRLLGGGLGDGLGDGLEGGLGGGLRGERLEAGGRRGWRWERASRFEIHDGRVRERYGSEESPSSLPLPASHLSIRLSIRGRQIADVEVLRLARECGCSEIEVWRFLQCETEAGRGVWLAAVGGGWGGWGMVCRRCGCRGSGLEEWPGYYGRGYTCKECAALGAVSSLSVLWRSREGVSPEDAPPAGGAEGENGEDVLAIPFAVARAQERASREVEGLIGERVLVWAACGAGKTEVCFSRIARALREGKRVLFAAPRRDVINDIVPRLEAAFPRIEKAVLSGASAERFGSGQLVAATTHQVARFYRAFDLIVLDELDAFPFTAEDFLRRALDQALRPGGRMVCLTATPHPEILRVIRAGRCGLVHLPARFHRKPLPVPVWQKCPLPAWEETNALVRSPLAQNPRGRSSPAAVTPLPSLSAFLNPVLERLAEKGLVLFFVPRVADVMLWMGWLEPLLPGRRIGGSWSSDPERMAKVEALRAGAFDVFVTTTILERGITLDKVQVIVVWADHPLFDERTLVQMAGRAGRRRENPDGEVVFLAGRCSKAMGGAKGWIEEQNALARRLNLIDG
ncbi:MAG: DEAD/DEAH box helicase, partial [Gracilibacteraceae bacterium]|nr:DEAD/DEAH box helicase [Gracilibacteraceae bacterium]